MYYTAVTVTLSLNFILGVIKFIHLIERAGLVKRRVQRFVYQLAEQRSWENLIQELIERKRIIVGGQNS
jgi:hypothetical protein